MKVETTREFRFTPVTITITCTSKKEYGAVRCLARKFRGLNISEEDTKILKSIWISIQQEEATAQGDV